MNCLVCGAKAELIDVTIDGVSIACPKCGEYAVSSADIAWRDLNPSSAVCFGRSEAFGAAWRSPCNHDPLARVVTLTEAEPCRGRQYQRLDSSTR